ncbi:MAG: nickel pincer cofactor biosynthesis protein LarC [Acidimicrobiales bacterium]
MTTTPDRRRIAWFHCFGGIAGDMALGSLIDAGAPVEGIREICEQLPVAGWRLEAEPVLRNGIGGTKAHVIAETTNVVRTAGHIATMLDEADLPDRVRERAHAVFWALAQAEGHLHRQPPEQVHFHEVGAIDAIVDIVGTCAALELLGVDEVASSPVAHGVGTIRAAHGVLPNPPPAVVELLRGAPTVGLDIPMELTTPTGAAIVAALAVEWGPMPDMVIAVSGFGAGTRELEDRPNLVQVVIGDRTAHRDRGQPVTLLEVNVDDATGEVLAGAVAALLDAGAHDAWITPVVMKKGRPGHVVSALADPALVDQVARVLTSSTGSLGVRASGSERWPIARRADEVEVDGMPVRVKVSPGRVKVEHDDAARVARAIGRPVREVLARAEAAGIEQLPSDQRPDPDPGPPVGHLHDHDHDHGHTHDHGHPHDHATDGERGPDLTDPDGGALA